MLSRGERAARHDEIAVELIVVRLEHLDARERVGGAEVAQVGGAAERRRLHRGDAAEAKVDELVEERRGRRVARAARLVKVRGDNLLVLARVGRDGHRVPHLHEERLEVVGEPVALRVRVDHCHQAALGGNRRPLGHRLDLDRKLPAALVENVLPAGLHKKREGREVREA